LQAKKVGDYRFIIYKLKIDTVFKAASEALPLPRPLPDCRPRSESSRPTGNHPWQLGANGRPDTQGPPEPPPPPLCWRTSTKILPSMELLVVSVTFNGAIAGSYTTNVLAKQ
jgi:hypothetical protein